MLSFSHPVYCVVGPRSPPTNGYSRSNVKELAMSKRRLLAIFVALVLTIAATAMWSASTIEREGDPDANAIEDSGSSAGGVTEKKKTGNKVVRIFAAPFKALGRLFSNKDDHKFQRITEKDAKKFESVGVARVEDSHSPAVKKQSTPVSSRVHCSSRRLHLLRRHS